MVLSEDFRVKLKEAVNLLLVANYAICLTGAGVSVESGIRPYRGPGGLWTERGEPPMDAYQRFLTDPKGWWDERLGPQKGRASIIARRVDANPNPGHYALVELEALGVLKCLITQNVDNLHRRAGSVNLLEIHGNASRLRCIVCNSRFDRDTFRILEIPPKCPDCGGFLKSDGVMFGEPIPTDVLDRCRIEVSRCDCLLVVGTSAVVYPAASFPEIAKGRGAKLIELNASDTALSRLCDVVLRGLSGEVLPLIVDQVKNEKFNQSSS